MGHTTISFAAPGAVLFDWHFDVRFFTMWTMRTAIYARVSTDDQTCEQQLTALRDYVSARGWKIQGEYVDQAISGVKQSRPAFDKLLATARARQIDAVIVWKLDRFGRSLSHLVSVTQELSSLGVRFIATTQGIDTDEGNPTARLLLHLMASFAEFERELIRERTRAGVARARRQGKRIGRPRRVFRHDVARELAAQGKSQRAIALELGVTPSHRGGSAVKPRY